MQVGSVDVKCNACPFERGVGRATSRRLVAGKARLGRIRIKLIRADSRGGGRNCRVRRDASDVLGQV